MVKTWTCEHFFNPDVELLAVTFHPCKSAESVCLCHLLLPHMMSSAHLLTGNKNNTSAFMDISGGINQASPSAALPTFSSFSIDVYFDFYSPMFSHFPLNKCGGMAHFGKVASVQTTRLLEYCPMEISHLWNEKDASELNSERKKEGSGLSLNRSWL